MAMTYVQDYQWAQSQTGTERQMRMQHEHQGTSPDVIPVFRTYCHTFAFFGVKKAVELRWEENKVDQKKEEKWK